ncbi:YafY family protein [Jiulongibacter sediminis]|uniref:helix-turn-helix transcriptional regulator n=1 Tax=Jiulongibacter sediminis TaxID=1605367 RepID=UPI0026EB73C0|nr:WYL domain-containing protein [Jiulongibacter sediminis]
MVRFDISTLREFGAQIKGHRFTGYFYEEPFSLLQALEGVNEADTNEVISFIRQSASEAAPILNLDKLLIQFEQNVRNPEIEENPFIQYEKVELRNIEKLDKFYRYIEERRTIEIEYKSFGLEEAETKIIRPVLLKQYNNRWTLIAFDKLKAAYQNFPLDRIEAERFSSESLVGENSFDSQNYFMDVIGSTVRENPLTEIVFKILKGRAYYVENKKWHNSQKVILEDNYSMTFSISIKPNDEFWAKVMEHIEDIEIVNPPPIQEEFLRRVSAICQRLIPEKKIDLRNLK